MKKFIVVFAFVAGLTATARAGIFSGGPNKAVFSGASSAGSLGQTTGKTDFESGVNDTLIMSSSTAVGGTVGWGHVYLQYGDADKNFTVCLYDSSGNILAYGTFTPADSGPGWFNVALNTSITLTNGAVYFGGLLSNDTVWRLYALQPVSGKNVRALSLAYTSTPGNITIGSSSVWDPSYQVTIYFDNSASSPL